MDASDFGTRLRALRVVPVVSVDDAADAPDLAAALAAGGLPVVEITFRTAAAAEAITSVRVAHPDVLVGAGTVLDVATVDRAAAAGAQFIVAPGYNAAVVARARELGLPMIPGAVTPTEIEHALAGRIPLLKFFPAEAAGGARYLKAVSAPYAMARFMPTGGITPDNLAGYLALPSVVAVGGTWIAQAEAIRGHRWADIAAAAAAAREIAVAADA